MTRDEIPITAIELSKLLGVTPRTIGNMIKAGSIPAPLRAGQARLWFWSDVVEHLKTRRDAS